MKNTVSTLQRSRTNSVDSELEKFQALQAEHAKSGSVFRLDPFGFVILPPHRPSSEKFDLLVTGLIHGDETVGLQAINQFLELLLGRHEPLKISVAVLLCNVAAARAGKRFIENDLNRSFLIPEAKSEEQMRAAAVGKIVEKAKITIDLHQTVEATTKPFYVIGHEEETIRWAHFLDPHLDIVTFPPMGFSHSGKTLVEHAAAKGGRGLVIEWGQKGFSEEQAASACRFLFSAIEKIECGAKPEKQYRSVPVISLKEFVRNTPGAALSPGITNFLPVKKGEVIGVSDSGPLLSSHDGFLFFPKYGELARVSPEICEIGVVVEVLI